MKRLSLLIMILCLSLLSYPQNKEWKKALKINSIESYTKFLKKFPEGNLSDSASKRIEILSYNQALSSASVLEYENFIKKYPESRYSADLRSKFASVKINAPSVFYSQPNYYNIEGPVWVFKVTFKEVNGIAAVIDQKMMNIYSKDGTIWGDSSFEGINDNSEGQTKTKIALKPFGTDSYESWVNSPACDFCGAKMVLYFKGKDEMGNEILIQTSFILVK
jgi:hypothetical protein